MTGPRIVKRGDDGGAPLPAHTYQWFHDLLRDCRRYLRSGLDPVAGRSPRRLEHALALHQTCIHLQWELLDELLRLLATAVRDPDDRRVLAEVAAEHAVVARTTLLFSPFWLRRPSTWKGGAEPSLTAHLFERYEVPPTFHTAWKDWPEFNRFHWVIWHLILAQGGSLFRMSRGYPTWQVRRGLQAWLHRFPPDWSIEQTVLAANICQRGGSRRDVEQQLAHPAQAALDPLRPSHDDKEFWEFLTAWLIRHSARITDEESRQVLDLAHHLFSEAWGFRFGARRFFQHSPRTILRWSEEYRRRREALTELAALGRWPGHDLDWTCEPAAGRTWTFAELTSGQELHEEGVELRHCVQGYTAACLAGRSAIVSLRGNGERALTIEVDPRQRLMVQARGSCNRPPSAEERLQIGAWAEACGVEIR